ncbi:PIN domain-containing protein [Cyanothece sp. BG0011]|uniref:PIN domain-containing protein n=1 Tax=Cyanothece sp. BG0011 TaxID=2082950 RepID=UPI0013009D6B|nr:PIN domain-containing protein [Cyanothece sp. BG0011]
MVDPDIILEYLLNRGDFRIEAEVIWKMIESQVLELFVTENGLEKVHFYVRQLTNTNDGIKIIKSLQKKLKICPVDKDIIYEAKTSNLRNFDAAIQVICATQMRLDAIVAWNPKDFDVELSSIKILSIYEIFKMELDKNFSQESINFSENLPEQTKNVVFADVADASFRLDELTSESKLARLFKEGHQRLNVVNIISGNASSIVSSSVSSMIAANETLSQIGGNCYPHRRMAACLRDTEIILRYTTYALFCGDSTVLEDRCLKGLREIYLALGVPIDSSIYSITMMKNNIINLIDDLHKNSKSEWITTDGDYSSIKEELNNYFDIIVSSLS